MRHLTIILTAFFLSSCCSKYDDKDFEFTDTHNKLLKAYSKSDTIYFADQTGDLDTIAISNIDTIQQCGCLMVGNRRAISIKIKHLPFNKWTGGTEMSQNKPPKVLDQDLIVIEKILNERDAKYFIGINYRNFMGKLKDLSKMSSDNRFEKFGIINYWTIINEAADRPQYKQDTTIITKVFWTEKYGLAGYELRNGKTYQLKKNVP